MKVAYICNFSYPFWEGVWNNVYHLAKHMVKKGHEVHVFSSNMNPTGNPFSKFDKFEGIHIHRFPVKRKIGAYGLFFDFEQELERINPDIIHCHVYRNPSAHKALKIARKLKKPCFLTTHAPFARRRSFFASLSVKLYDFFYSRKILNSYTKVIAITNWEIPYLLKLGCKKDKIRYIPNGVDNSFFIKIDKKIKNQIIYLGRISKIKNLEILINLARHFPNLRFEIIGPVEKDYHLRRKSKNLQIINKKFNQKEEIKYLKESDIYILPSKSEGFPQTLLEAMASGKIIISSQTKGALEIIKKWRNGFIFYNFVDLIKKVKYCLQNFDKLIFVRKEAQKTARDFLWKDITKKIEGLYKEFIIP